MLNRMQLEGVALKTWTYAGTPFARMVNRPDPGIDGGDKPNDSDTPYRTHQCQSNRDTTSLTPSKDGLDPMRQGTAR